MIRLTKENIVEYVKSRLTFLDKNGTYTVSMIGEGSVEDDGDGFLNFVFRVSDGHYKLIVKQSFSHSKSNSYNDLDENRYKLEYETMKIRKVIVPDLVPDVYDIDEENRVFITEDVSHLKISRFQLLKGVQFPKLADDIGRFMAATQFYTSVYYLDCKTFRNLCIRFTNTKMRAIMEQGMFLTSVVPEDTAGRRLDPEFATFSRQICADPKVRVARQKLRHLFMSKGECLIHGDLHTSNIFAGPDETKVIDMEYTFCGPFAYDMGYFLANFIAQYAAAMFRPFDSEEDRQSYKAYCLKMIRDTYLSYCSYFCTYWLEDAKPEYQNIPGLMEDFCITTLREFIGFGASAMLGRISNIIPYADYDDIKDPVQKHNAKCYSIILNKQMLTHYNEYQSIDQFIQDMLTIEKVYMSNVASYDPATDTFKGGML